LSPQDKSPNKTLEDIFFLTYEQIVTYRHKILKKQGNIIPPNAHNVSITRSSDPESVEKLDK
jgi:hypothetical protein